MAAKYSAKGLVVVGPSLDAKAIVEKFKEKHGVTYAMCASSEPLAQKFGASLYPVCFVVGKDGKIVYKGDVDEPGCKKAIEAALDAK